MLNKIISIVWVAGLSHTASGNEVCPLPIGMEMSVSLAKMASGAKLMGLSKSDFTAKIPKPPDNHAWLLPIIEEVADEVFDYSSLHPEVYAGYRFEVCFIKNQNPGVELNFSDSHHLLKKCELVESAKRLRCAMEVANDVSGVKKIKK